VCFEASAAVYQRQLQQRAFPIGEQVEDHVVGGVVAGHPERAYSSGDAPLECGEAGSLAGRVVDDELAVEYDTGRHVAA
jgi:hypothetical protein